VRSVCTLIQDVARGLARPSPDINACLNGLKEDGNARSSMELRLDSGATTGTGPHISHAFGIPDAEGCRIRTVYDAGG
jgi:hypothetical protein